MKETTRNTLKRIGKFIVIYYAIEAVIAAIILAVYTTTNGVERTKEFVRRYLRHMKEYYSRLIRGDFRGARAAANDEVLDEAENFMRHRFGDDFAESAMSDCYDELETRRIPFTRKNGFVSRPIDETKVPEDIRRRAE